VVIARLRALWQALEIIPWTCARCHARQGTPRLLWDTVKYALICRQCRYLQNYPEYVRPIDPYPPGER
jgi:hypothetical protein